MRAPVIGEAGRRRGLRDGPAAGVGGGHVVRRLPEPALVGGESQRRLGAVVREIGLMKGRGAKRFVPHTGERAKRFLDAQLNLDHRRAVARDQHEGVLEQVLRPQGRHMHARIGRVLWRPLRRAALRPQTHEPHGAPDDVDRRAGIVHRWRQRPQRNFAHHREAETRILIEAARFADGESPAHGRRRLLAAPAVAFGHEPRKRRIGVDKGAGIDRQVQVGVGRVAPSRQRRHVDMLDIADSLRGDRDG